jgi:tryptophanyl-tRNA synthetase
MTKTPRVMSGMRTTDRLHMGNYFGALKNWVELQKTHECFFGAMNWHAMTDGYKTPDIFIKNTRDMIIDFIAMGIDPNKSVLFIQSEVPGLLELNMLLTVLTPLGWLERVTTWKDAEEDMKLKDAHNLGRFAYPVLQTADILIFKGELVPVGKDQVPHLELAREIIRRLNFLYKSKLPEPKALLTETPNVIGLDGRKMSKSYGNVLPLLDEPANIEKICKGMVTDPARVRRTDPGNPEVCPVFSFHKLFTETSERSQIDGDCRTAAIGCMDCKMKLAHNINLFMKEPLQKRKELLNKPAHLDEIIQEGCKRAGSAAKETMSEVKEALGWQV